MSNHFKKYLLNSSFIWRINRNLITKNINQNIISLHGEKYLITFMRILCLLFVFFWFYKKIFISDMTNKFKTENCYFICLFYYKYMHYLWTVKRIIIKKRLETPAKRRKSPAKSSNKQNYYSRFCKLISKHFFSVSWENPFH